MRTALPERTTGNQNTYGVFANVYYDVDLTKFGLDITARYNQGLSVRRAEAVRAELVRNGVPRDAITVQGFGENRPLVPTAQGVREPQNRRVEIVLR